MNEQFQPRPDDQTAQTRSFLPVTADPFAPTQQFPAADHPTEQFPTRHVDEQRYAAPHYPEPRCAARPLVAPVEPLAHEGGLAYGTLPAAVYGAMDPFIPRHLHVPQPFTHGPLPQQFGYPPQVQQMVVVHDGGRRTRRVNHVLHLILSVLTFGLWLPVWMILAIANS